MADSILQFDIAHEVADSGRFEQIWGSPVPKSQGLNLLQMMENAKEGKLRALYVVGSNPVRRYEPDFVSSPNIFLVVEDLFLTETAALADVVLPAACGYEKSGTFTNTCGDLQFIKKAGDVAGPKSDLEIMAHLAHKMGWDVRKLSTRGEWLRADLGQSRGVQSGEADRHAIWLRGQAGTSPIRTERTALESPLSMKPGRNVFSRIKIPSEGA